MSVKKKPEVLLTDIGAEQASATQVMFAPWFFEIMFHFALFYNVLLKANNKTGVDREKNPGFSTSTRVFHFNHCFCQGNIAQNLPTMAATGGSAQYAHLDWRQ